MLNDLFTRQCYPAVEFLHAFTAGIIELQHVHGVIVWLNDEWLCTRDVSIPAVHGTVAICQARQNLCNFFPESNTKNEPGMLWANGTEKEEGYVPQHGCNIMMLYIHQSGSKLQSSA